MKADWRAFCSMITAERTKQTFETDRCMERRVVCALGLAALMPLVAIAEVEPPLDLRQQVYRLVNEGADNTSPSSTTSTRAVAKRALLDCENAARTGSGVEQACTAAQQSIARCNEFVERWRRERVEVLQRVDAWAASVGQTVGQEYSDASPLRGIGKQRDNAMVWNDNVKLLRNKEIYGCPFELPNSSRTPEQVLAEARGANTPRPSGVDPTGSGQGSGNPSSGAGMQRAASDPYSGGATKIVAKEITGGGDCVTVVGGVRSEERPSNNISGIAITHSAPIQNICPRKFRILAYKIPASEGVIDRTIDAGTPGNPSRLTIECYDFGVGAKPPYICKGFDRLEALAGDEIKKADESSPPEGVPLRRNQTTDATEMLQGAVNEVEKERKGLEQQLAAAQAERDRLVAAEAERQRQAERDRLAAAEAERQRQARLAQEQRQTAPAAATTTGYVGAQTGTPTNYGRITWEDMSSLERLYAKLGSYAPDAREIAEQCDPAIRAVIAETPAAAGPERQYVYWVATVWQNGPGQANFIKWAEDKVAFHSKYPDVDARALACVWGARARQLRSRM